MYYASWNRISQHLIYGLKLIWMDIGTTVAGMYSKFPVNSHIQKDSYANKQEMGT